MTALTLLSIHLRQRHGSHDTRKQMSSKIHVTVNLADPKPKHSC